MLKIIRHKILAVAFLSAVLLSSAPASAYVFNSSYSGSITIQLDSGIDSEDHGTLYRGLSGAFTTFSQLSTSMSIFTTSVLYFTGYSPEQASGELGPISLRQNQSYEHRSSTGELFMFMGVLGSSLAGYRFGFSNDLLAVLPVVPSWDSASSVPGKYDVYEFDYGLFVYFSKDF